MPFAIRLLLAGVFFVSSSYADRGADPPVAETPTVVAERFARAFEARDFEAVETFFAPDAHVSRVAISAKSPARYQALTAEAWVESTRRQHEQLSDIRLDIHETTTLRLDFAASVSVLYSFRCSVGEKTFISRGIDTYQMSLLDGEWKIKHYTYVDRVSPAPSSPR